METNTNYYKNSRPEIIAFLPKNISKILDIGCGQGHFLKLVKEKTGAETWGLEVVDSEANIAKNYSDRILIGKVEDTLDLIPNTFFDCITLNDVLEHLIEPKDVLRKLNNKLTKNGIIVASIPNVRFIENLYELLIKKDWEYKKDGILDSTHLRFFTKKSMKRLFEDAGYEIILQEGINKTQSWKLRLMNFFTFGFFQDTEFCQYVCVASKK